MIKTAYPNFVNVMTKDAGGNVLTAPTVDLWHRRLSTNGITADQALQALDKHIDSSRFEPTISDIINNKPVLSNYDIQALEQKEQQLLLEAYHKDNEVVPMPDSVKEMLADIVAKSKAGVPDE